MKKINIAFAGWWTWWHVFPIKSLIEYIQNNKKQDFNIYWTWQTDSLEYDIANQLSNVKFLPIESGKLRRQITFKNIINNFKDWFKFLKWIRQSISHINKYNIDIIFCKWGFVSLPMVLASVVKNKKLLLHESDTVPGLSNRIANKFADIKYSGFEWVLKNSKCIWQILSTELLEFDSNDLDTIRQLIDNNNVEKNTNILLAGWSQWSRFILQNLLKLAKKQKKLFKKFNFFIILGLKNQKFRSSFEKFDNVAVFDFVDQSKIWALCSICDIWLTRSSATFMAEQKLFNLKLFMLPLPYTWGNHQYHNAIKYQKEYDDVLLEQNDDFLENFIEKLKKYKWYKKIKIQNIKDHINKNKKTIVNDIINSI